jgi:hypothetical protein
MPQPFFLRRHCADIVEKLFSGASQKFSKPLARRLEGEPGAYLA